MKRLLITSLLLFPLAAAADTTEITPYHAPEKIEDHPAYSVLEAVSDTFVYRIDGSALLLGDYIDALREVDPGLIKYCMQKTLNARIVIEFRNERGVEDAVDLMMEGVRGPNYVKVDTERMVRDIYREDGSSGRVDFDKVADVKQYLMKEMKSCFINKF